MIATVETLQVRPPFDWEGLLSFFAPRAIPGVESVGGGVLRRSFNLNGETGSLEVSYNGSTIQLAVWGQGSMAARARRVLDLDFDPTLLKTTLGGDPFLAPVLENSPGVRLPGAWDEFEMGVRAILGQQVSVKAAHTLAGRIVARYGRGVAHPLAGVDRVFPTAAELAEVPAVELATIGLPGKRAETLAGFARWSAQPPGERGPLLELPGIGPWTESYLRMRGESDRDAFPAGDLGIHKALGLQQLGPAKATREAERLSQAWRPYRAYAVFLLWRSLA